MTTLQPPRDPHLDRSRPGRPSVPSDRHGDWVKWVGGAAVVFSFVYWVSDLLEVVQGDFSTARLVLTYAGEAAIPLFALGLYAAQRPRIGRLGLFGAVAYAYAYVFFTSTVMYALVAGTSDYRALSRVFGVWMTVHGAVMVIGGVTFGIAVIRAGVLPRWTAACLMVGVVFVAAAANSSNLVRTVAATLPAAAFTGMGAAVIRRSLPADWRYFLGGKGKKPLVRRM
jgi:hypothetical protein